MLANVSVPFMDAAATTAATRQVITENVDRVRVAFDQVFALIPSLVAMLLVRIIGYIVARMVGRAVRALTERLGLQRAAERSGLIESMKHDVERSRAVRR